ncbi:MAG: response regulator [Dissulfurispiraceae bacterium]|jgi:CheY-like chemotaxis protein
MDSSELKKKILVVDDENSFCVLLKANLEKRGPFEVLTTSNPHDVVRLAKEFQPDLILLDILMPGMDGMTVAAELKGNNYTEDIPIAFLTALADEEDVREFRSRTGDKYILSKLGTNKELMVSITEIITAKSRGE